MNNGSIEICRVLLIDDDEDDYFLTRSMLSQAQGRKFQVDWAPTYEQGQQRLQSNDYHAVLVDYDLGLHTGIEFIREYAANRNSTPLILYTGRGNYDVDIEAMEAGATLYLTKSEVNPLLLERSIRYAIEHRLLEAELERRLQERSEILESIQDGFFAIDQNWYFTYINCRAAQNVGFEPVELLGRNIWETFPALLGTSIEKNYRTVMEQNEPVQFEAADVYKGLWYSISVYPSQGGISIYWRDITERKQAEEALRAKETTLRGILDATKESVWLFDPDGTILLANETAVSRLKRPVEEVLGRNFRQFVPEELAKARQERLNQVVETREPIEFEDERAGILFQHNFYPVMNTSRHVTSIVAFSRNITERKHVEEVLYQSEEKFARIFQYSPTAMTITRLSDGLYTDANESFCKLVGYNHEEIIGHSSVELGFFTQAERELVLSQFHKNGCVHQQEFNIVTKYGTICHVLFSLDPIETGGEPSILATMIDITKRKKDET